MQPNIYAGNLYYLPQAFEILYEFLLQNISITYIRRNACNTRRDKCFKGDTDVTTTQVKK